MDQDIDPPAPDSASARAHWTPAKQRLFLTALLDSGSVAQAARAAGMSRSSAHRLRVRLAGTPFDEAWSRVLDMHARRLADPFGKGAQPFAPAHPPGASSEPR